MKLTLILIAAAAIASADVKVNQPRPGAPGQWRLLGRTTANHSADHDVVVVAGPYDNFRALKFKVTGANLNMQHMIVTYDSGGVERMDVRQNIPESGESRVLDLRGVGNAASARLSSGTTPRDS